jgi:hypothetical protein
MPEESTNGTIGIEVGTSEIAPDGEQDNDEFGAGMWADGPDAEGDDEISNGTTTTGGTPEVDPTAGFDINTVSLTADPSTVPEQHRALFERMQSQFKGLQTTLNERNGQLVELRNGQPQQQPQPQEQAPEQRTPQTPSDDPLNPYAGVIDIPETLSPQQRQEVIAGAHQVDQLIAHRLDGYRDYLDAMPQMVDALSELVNRAQAGDNEAVNTSKQEVIDAYGENAPNVPAVVALVQSGAPNPATGNPFTYREAYERMHGITTEQVAEIDAKARAARTRAKASGAGSPRANTATPANNHFTAEQASSRMAAAGWAE